MTIQKSILPIHILFFLFPILISTMHGAGGVLYFLIFLPGLLLGWQARKSLEPWEIKLLIGFVIFFVLICISLINTQDLVLGVKKIERYIHFPLLIPMYLLLRRYKIETGKVFVLGAAVASVAMCGQAVYQTSVLEWPRAIGAYNSIILGDISMLVALLICSALLTISNKKWHFILGGGLIILAITASILSGTRGAWLAIPFIIPFFFWVMSEKIGTKSFVLLTSLVFVLIIGAMSNDQIKSRITDSINQYRVYLEHPEKFSSVGVRLEMWSDSIAIWKEHPIIGTGIGDFKRDKLELFIQGKSNLKSDFGHAHNIYFDILATAGIVGLIGLLYFALFWPFKTFYLFWGSESDSWSKFYALSGMVTIISFVVFGLTEGWLARSVFVKTYLMCILVFMSSIAIRKSKQAQSIEPESLNL